MSEDKWPYLQGFGFLPKNKTEQKQQKVMSRHIGCKPSERYYLKDAEGVYLTACEAEISWLVANGKTVRESAEKMAISVRTAEFYLCNVRRKLNVRNKNELVRVLFDNNFFKCL